MVQVASICKGRMRNRNQVTCPLVLIPEKGTLLSAPATPSVSLYHAFSSAVWVQGFPGRKGSPWQEARGARSLGPSQFLMARRRGSERELACVESFYNVSRTT